MVNVLVDTVMTTFDEQYGDRTQGDVEDFHNNHLGLNSYLSKGGNGGCSSKYNDMTYAELKALQEMPHIQRDPDEYRAVTRAIVRCRG